MTWLEPVQVGCLPENVDTQTVCTGSQIIWYGTGDISKLRPPTRVFSSLFQAAESARIVLCVFLPLISPRLGLRLLNLNSAPCNFYFL